MSNSLQPCGLYSPWNSLGWNTGVGTLSLLQEIFPTQVSHVPGGFFTSRATREAHIHLLHLFLPLPTFITLSPRLKSMPPACLPEVYSILSKPYSDADGILIFFKNKIKSLVNKSHPCLKTPASFLLHKGKLPDSPS